MPHQCTECGEIYEDGSEEIFDGCGECGNNKFQFVHTDNLNAQGEIDLNEPVEEDAIQESARSQMVSKSELDRHTRDYERRKKDAPPRRRPDTSTVSEDDLPSSPPVSVERDVSEIKDNLNTQFEGIRVIEQGKYEINLTQLFERETQIISVQEDGKYIINVPETFEATEEDPE